jgi:hypothetical protein
MERGREKMLNEGDEPELTEPYQMTLGTSACKEGAVVVVGKRTPQRKKNKGKTGTTKESDFKSRNLQKKGTMIHRNVIQDEQP